MDYIFCSSKTFKVTSILTLPTLAEIESEDPRMAKIKVDPLFGHCPPRFIKAFEGCRENINKKCAEKDYIESTYEYFGKCKKGDRAF